MLSVCSDPLSLPGVWAELHQWPPNVWPGAKTGEMRLFRMCFHKHRIKQIHVFKEEMMKSLLQMGVVYLLSGTFFFFCRFVWQGLIKRCPTSRWPLPAAQNTNVVFCLFTGTGDRRCFLADNLSAVPYPLMLRPWAKGTAELDILEKAAGVRMPPSGGKAEHTGSGAEEKTNDAVAQCAIWRKWEKD